MVTELIKSGAFIVFWASDWSLALGIVFGMCVKVLFFYAFGASD